MVTSAAAVRAVADRDNTDGPFARLAVASILSALLTGLDGAVSETLFWLGLILLLIDALMLHAA